MRTNEEINEVGQIIDLTSTLAYEGRFAAIDDLLDNIDFSASELILMSYVRSTFPMRQKLYRWMNTVQRISQELDRRSLNSSRILHGLL